MHLPRQEDPQRAGPALPSPSRAQPPGLGAPRLASAEPRRVGRAGYLLAEGDERRHLPPADSGSGRGGRGRGERRREAVRGRVRGRGLRRAGLSCAGPGAASKRGQSGRSLSGAGSRPRPRSRAAVAAVVPAAALLQPPHAELMVMSCLRHGHSRAAERRATLGSSVPGNQDKALLEH